MDSSAAKSRSESFLSTRDMALVSLFALLTGVGAMIRIPIPISPMPMTLQTAMVFLAGALLGSRRGSIAMAMYMAIGLIGLPVFTQGGGFHNIISPSFGFVIGFIPAAWIIGRVCESGRRPGSDSPGALLFARASRQTAACLFGYAAYNAIGVLWLHANINLLTGKTVTLYQSFLVGMVPFILPDMLKLVAAVALVSVVARRVKSLESPPK